MVSWKLLLGGLLVWTVHFFTLYTVASIFLDTLAARLLTLAATVACLVMDVVIWRKINALQGGDELVSWMRSLAYLGTAISIIAILWQALPAILL